MPRSVAIRCSMVATEAPDMTDRRAQIGRADVTIIGRDLAIPAVIEIGPVEVNAAIRLGRVQGHRRGVTTVDTNARQRRAIASVVCAPLRRVPIRGTRPLVFGPRRFRGPTAALGLYFRLG